MAADLTPDDAVRAITRLTTVLESLARDLHALTDHMERWTRRAERWMRWHFWLLVVVLCATGGTFVVGIWTHAAQNDALRQVMQENKAIFERVSR
jgi:hypothetical protein